MAQVKRFGWSTLFAYVEYRWGTSASAALFNVLRTFGVNVQLTWQ